MSLQISYPSHFWLFYPFEPNITVFILWRTINSEIFSNVEIFLYSFYSFYCFLHDALRFLSYKTDEREIAVYFKNDSNSGERNAKTFEKVMISWTLLAQIIRNSSILSIAIKLVGKKWNRHFQIQKHCKCSKTKLIWIQSWFHLEI